jgi:polyisoprenoid-binding protein YceI
MMFPFQSVLHAVRAEILSACTIFLVRSRSREQKYHGRAYMNVSMNKICCILTTLLLISLLQPVQADDFSISQIYPIDRGHSYIGFSIQYMGYAKVRGRFTDFSGTFRFDEKDITNSSGTVLIKVDSIDTDLDMRDDDLRSPNWFDGKQYPLIKFQTKQILKSDAGVIAVGDLTIKKVTKEVQLKMDYCSGVKKDVRQDTQIVFTGGTTINRKDFGVEGEKWSKIKEGITAVDSKVEIELSILGKQINAPNFTNWVSDTETPEGKIYKVINESSVEKGIQEFRTMKTTNKSEIDFNALDTVGYMLLKEKKVEEAITVFKENAESFPDEFSVYDSLAEAYAVRGDRTNAIQYYGRSLKMEPYNANAVEILRHLQVAD